MNPDPQAWQDLRKAASAQLPPGFAGQVLRAARERPRPSLASQFALGAATAALCFAGAILYQTKVAGSDSDKVLADWQQIAADGDASASVSGQ